MLIKASKPQSCQSPSASRAASATGEKAILAPSLLAFAAAVLGFLAAPTDARSQWAVEVDPATFVLDGYSLHGRYSPGSYPGWRVGVGLYSLEFPDAFIDLNGANRNEGWELDLQQGVGLFVERYLNEENTGWFTGLQLAGHDFSLANPRLSPGSTEEYTNVLVMPYGGYLHRFTSNIYVQGWAGAGYTDKVSGSNTLSGEEFEISPIFAFTALHLGYSF